MACGLCGTIRSWMPESIRRRAAEIERRMAIEKLRKTQDPVHDAKPATKPDSDAA